MDTIWLIQWESNDKKYLAIYENYRYARKEYDKSVNFISKRAKIIKESKHWELREFRFKKTIFQDDNNNIEELLLREEIVRKEKNLIK